MYVKVLILEPHRSTPPLGGFHTFLVSISANCMYVKVLLNEPLSSTHKTSSWWVVYISSTLRMPKFFWMNHLGQYIKPPLGGFYNLLVCMFETCMRKSSFLNHLGQHRIPFLDGFHTLLVSSLLYVCMSKMSSSLNHLGHNIKPLLVSFTPCYPLLVCLTPCEFLYVLYVYQCPPHWTT